MAAVTCKGSATELSVRHPDHRSKRSKRPKRRVDSPMQQDLRIAGATWGILDSPWPSLPCRRVRFVERAPGPPPSGSPYDRSHRLMLVARLGCTPDRSDRGIGATRQVRFVLRDAASRDWWHFGTGGYFPVRPARPTCRFRHGVATSTCHGPVLPPSGVVLEQSWRGSPLPPP